jgi:hypothetical protein
MKNFNSKDRCDKQSGEIVRKVRRRRRRRSNGNTILARSPFSSIASAFNSASPC